VLQYLLPFARLARLDSGRPFIRLPSYRSWHVPTSPADIYLIEEKKKMLQYREKFSLRMTQTGLLQLNDVKPPSLCVFTTADGSKCCVEVFFLCQCT
jgi:hypothetical protein